MRRLPKYCKQHNRDIGFYYKNGEKVYLPGSYNSVQSLTAYHNAMLDGILYGADMSKRTLTRRNFKTEDGYLAWKEAAKAEQDEITLIEEAKITRVVAESLKPVIADIAPQKPKSELTVQGLYDKFYNNIPKNYPDKIKTTQDDYRKSFKDLLALYGEKGTEGNTLVADFGIAQLRKVQDAMETRLSAKTCNEYLTRIRGVFNWAAGEVDDVDVVADKLKKVKKLKEDDDTDGREDVPHEIVEKTLPHLPQMIQDMVMLQLNSAMRPGDLFGLTWAQIDTSENEWLYLPLEFKGRRHKDTDPIGFMPICKNILLERYKHLASDQLIFNQITNAEQIGRSTKRFTNEAFDRGSYLAFIKDACEKAGISPHWTPYQLRHRAITDMDAKVGKDAARKFARHTDYNTTEGYVHHTSEKLKEKERKRIRNEIKKAEMREVIRQRTVADQEQE